MPAKKTPKTDVDAGESLPDDVGDLPEGVEVEEPEEAVEADELPANANASRRLIVDVDVSFLVDYDESENGRRKPLDILGIDPDELTDDQIQAALDEKAAKLLETASLTVTNARVNKEN